MPASPPMSRASLRTLADARLADARVLLAARRYAAAYFLCGSAVECGLRAACLHAEVEPQTDDLSALVQAAGLGEDLHHLARSNLRFRRHWAVVKDWTPLSRYQQRSAAETADLFQAVADMHSGVLPWVKRYW